MNAEKMYTMKMDAGENKPNRCRYWIYLSCLILVAALVGACAAEDTDEGSAGQDTPPDTLLMYNYDSFGVEWDAKQKLEHKKQTLEKAKGVCDDKFQYYRFMYWIMEDDPELETTLIKQWLQCANEKYPLLSLDELKKRIEPLISGHMEQDKFLKFQQLEQAYRQLKLIKHPPMPVAREEKKIIADMTGDFGLINDQSPMGLVLLEKDEKFREAILAYLDQGGREDMRLVDYALRDIQRSLRRIKPDPKKLLRNFIYGGKVEDVNSYAHYLFYTQGQSVYAFALTECLKGLNYSAVEYQIIDLNKYLRYLKGQDAQFARLMFFYLTPSSEVRREVLTQILCTMDRSVTHEEVSSRLGRFLSAWPDEQRKQMEEDIKYVFSHIEDEKLKRGNYKYNLDDGEGYRPLKELAKPGIFSDLFFPYLPPQERIKRFHEINKLVTFESWFGIHKIWSFLFVIEQEPKVREAYIKSRCSVGGFIDRLNDHEREVRQQEIKKYRSR